MRAFPANSPKTPHPTDKEPSTVNDYTNPEKRDEDEPLELERNDIYGRPDDEDSGEDEVVADDAAEPEPEVDVAPEEDPEPASDAVPEPASHVKVDPEQLETEVPDVEPALEDEAPEPAPEAVPEPASHVELEPERLDTEVPDVEPAIEEPESDSFQEYEPGPEPMIAAGSGGLDVEPGAQVTRMPDQEERVRPEPFGALGWSLLVLLALGGGALRVLLYMKEPALWMDEAALVVQVLGLSYGELIRPLAEHQSAPIGFLLASKFFINMIGTDVLGLRAFPLGASIIGLLGTALLARKSLPVVGAVLAVAVAAISWPAIGYAAEFKQYSTDLMAASIMFVLGYGVLIQPSSRKRLAVFALAGAILQWFSLPVLFVLAGIGLVAGLDALLKGQTGKAGGLALVALVWGGSFVGNWFVALQHTAGDEVLRSWHHDAYLMFPPDRAWPAALKWMGWTFMDIFENPVGLVLPGVGMVGFVCGIFVIGRRNLGWLFMLLVPFVVMLIFSYLQRYPVYGRFVQFMLPALVVIVGAGLGEIVRLLWSNGQRTLAAAVVLVLFVQPIALAANELMKPGDPGIRPIVNHIAENAEADDGIYLHHWVRHEYAYHADQLDGVPIESAYVGVSSRNDWSWYAREIASLGGNDRVWFVLLEDDSHLAVGERKFFETELNRVGTPLEQKRWGDYWLYAYDLSSLEAVPLPESDPEEPALAEAVSTDDAEKPSNAESAIDDSPENLAPAEIE